MSDIDNVFTQDIYRTHIAQVHGERMTIFKLNYYITVRGIDFSD